MGNSSSSGSSSSAAYDSSKDPCDAAMQVYLKCVESHKDGLTEGDDCTPEATAYKECRKKSSVTGGNSKSKS